MKSKVFSFIFLTFFCFLALSVSAQQPENVKFSEILKAFRYYKDVNISSIPVPTIVEVPFSNDFLERFDFVVLDKTENSLEPYFFKQELSENAIPTTVDTIPRVGNTVLMIDGSTRTFTDFILPENAQGYTEITIKATRPITSSSLALILGDNVALPNTVEIRAQVGNENRIILARRSADSQAIKFPRTTSDVWKITFNFSQPLRISELRLDQENIIKSSSRSVRFLAQPGHTYRIYFDPDRQTAIPVGEAGNLMSQKDVLVLPVGLVEKNLSYTVSDIDNDGVPDILDNCVSVSNSDQVDVNGNGRGDLCDDFDADGVINSSDNCINKPNRNQSDIDSDGIGDVCDGEESRVTERLPWIPWVGIGLAGLVLITLLALTIKSDKTPPQVTGE